MKFKNTIDTKLLYSILPILPILAILFMTDSFYTDIETLKSDYNTNINHLIEEKQITINALITNRIAQAKIQNHNVKLDLMKEIRKEYDSTSSIINDLESKSVSDKLYNVLDHVLNNDYEKSKIYDVIERDHVVFISNNTGLVELVDRRIYNRNKYIIYKSWESFIDATYNKDLTKKSVDGILMMRDEIFLMESKYATTMTYNISDSFNIKSSNLLMDIIDKDDISTYKYFNVLIPTYITIDQSPNDIIIIREINLFNMIEPYIHAIHKYSMITEDYKHDMNRLIFIKVVSCIVLTATLLLSFFLALLSALEKIKEKR